MRKRTWEDAQLIEAVSTSYSYAQVARHLGLVPRGGTYKTVKAHINRLNLTTDHFTGKAWNTGKRFRPISIARPLPQILVENSPHSSSNNLKKRLLREQLLLPQCAACGRKSWIDPFTMTIKPIPLELDHINGVTTDNRLENLRLLDPVCHSFTPTYRGKNIKRLGVVVQSAGDNPLKRDTVVRSNRPGPTCSKCKQSCIGKMCKSCYTSTDRSTKIVWPSKEEILNKLATSNYTQLAKELGVSDNAIRKYLKR